MRRLFARFIVKRVMLLALGVPAAAGLLATALLLRPAQAAPPAQISLMQTLSAWRYPGSTQLRGASMSDGGNPLVQSIKCQAILTTADPIEKVVAFYQKKVGTPAVTGRPEEKGAVKGADARSVATQDDSAGRPVAVRVIVVNKADTSTTLVISRADAEKETHIAWLHYIRLEDARPRSE
jgi:hypothetical protein